MFQEAPLTTIDEKYIHNGPGENSIRLYNIHVILVSALYSVYGVSPGPLCMYFSSIVAVKPVDVPGSALNLFRK
jgi:hypothetical protein